MKFLAPFVAISLTLGLAAAEVPGIFAGLLKEDTAIKGQIGVILPPKEIDKYVQKVGEAARTNTKWFREYSASAKPGEPLPYDEKLGLTKTEYDEYIALWNKRDFKAMEEVVLMLRQSNGENWSITATGNASILSTLRFDPKTGSFRSPNGEMKRIADIKADASSILGEWTGKEWKFDEETGLGKMKENFAIGTLTGKKFGLLVYRAQEISSNGTQLLDKSIVVRFPIGGAAAAPTPKDPPAKTTPSKPAPKPTKKK